MNQYKDSGFLQEFEQEMYLDPVSPGVRFVNFLIDRVVFLGIIFVIALLWEALAGKTGATLDNSILRQNTIEAKLLDILLTAVLTVIYYTISEGVSKGRTIGKMVTGTIAIREDGVPFTFKDAFMRSLCRIIPFEPFSALGYRPWHDSMSKTAVVKKVW
jgi:uncharacterized RDD family membrane protein YckC